MSEPIEVDISNSIPFRSPIVTKEALIGATNDLLPIHFILEGAKVQQSIARLVVTGMYKGQLAKWYGTGFMISDDLMMTNHHVLPSSDEVKECVAEFNYQSDWNGMLQNVERFQGDLRFYLSNEDLDFAIIKINESPGKKFGKIKLDYTTQVLENESVYIIQHPRGREKEVALVNNHVVRIKRDPGDNFPSQIVHYTTDTEPGSSGSPVFTKAWDLAALHHASTSSGSTIVNEGMVSKEIINWLLKQFPSLTNEMKDYLRAALLDSNLPESTKNSIGFERIVTTRFFEGWGLETKEIVPGLEKVVTTTQGSEFFDLACWNIEWFGSPENANIRRISRVADYMHSMGMDLWGLVEVADPALETLKNIMYDNYGQKFKSILGVSNNPQHPAVFYESSKIECEEMDANGAFDDKWGSKELFPRKPLWVYVKAKGSDSSVFDFNLVVLHLKAFPSDPEANRQRTEQVRVLHSWLKDRVKKDSDKDYIMIGDWNDKIDSEPLKKIMKDNKLGILTREDAESGDKDAVSYVRKKKSLIDHIVISKDTKDEYVDDSIEIVRSDKVIPKFAATKPHGFSDHIPLVARFLYKNEN